MTTAAGEVQVPVLTDGVVRLRARTLADVPAITEMGRDPEAVQWTRVPSPYRERDAVGYVSEYSPAGWREQRDLGWAIDAPDDDGQLRFAGNVDIRTQPRPDIGYMLHPWARGRGVMSRAVRLATRWTFDVLGVPVVHWETHVGNLASWRVAWACGFTFHGEVPSYAPHRGDLRDAWLGSLRAADDGSPRTTWWSVPVLDGRQVRLRPHRDDDVRRIAEACSDPRTRQWLPTLPDPYTVDDARSFVTRRRLEQALGKAVAWAVADRDDDRLLADVALFRLDDPMCPGSAEIGYWAHPDARGRGAMSEAVRLAVDHAFRTLSEGGLGRHRVQLGASWTNTASRHVAERAGFRQVGHFRQDGLIGASDSERRLDDGAWYDRLATDPPPT